MPGQQQEHAVVSCVIGRVMLEFWLEKEQGDQVLTCWVRKAGDPAVKYPVFCINSSGECWRCEGLPADWGFQITTTGKIREVR